MKRTLAKIKKLNPELKPPTGSVVFGVTSDGKQLYRLVQKRSRAVPLIDTKTGEQRFRKNQMTGEPMYGLNKPELYEHERIFYLESEGNGNINIVDYQAPTAEELAKTARRQRVEDMRERLAEALVDADVDPRDLVASLQQGTAPVQKMKPSPAVTANVTTEPASFPLMYAPGRWRLSNGTVMQGKKTDAEEAESAISDDERAEVAEVREMAAMTPEQ